MYIWVVKHNPGMTVCVCHCLEPFFHIHNICGMASAHIPDFFMKLESEDSACFWEIRGLIHIYIHMYFSRNKVSESLLSLPRVYLSLLKLHLCISELHHGILHKPGWFSSGLQWPNVVQL